MPACADVSHKKEEFSSTTYMSSEQDKDNTKARISKDNSVMKALAVVTEARNPFGGDPSLRSISSGVVADETVNVDIARQVRENILKPMEGKPVEEFVFKKKGQAVTFNCKTQLKIDDDVVTVDPQLLFQRLISAARGNTEPEELKHLFTYELATQSAALFGMDTLIRAANKPQLTTAIWNQFKISRCLSQHVSVESSSLLHHSIYLWFICFPWWSIDELENLHADWITVCFEP